MTPEQVDKFYDGFIRAQYMSDEEIEAELSGTGGSMTELTDAEVLCEFMEARIDINSLDALHLVEAKLTKAQRLEYCLELSSGGKPETGYWRILHATAEQKLKALAAVLRGAGAAH